MPATPTVIALLAAALCLSACDSTAPTPPPAPPNPPQPAAPRAAPGSDTNPSVPSAESVFPPPGVAQPEPATTPTDGTRKPAQAAHGEPMPGQNNDHSAPLSTAR